MALNLHTGIHLVKHRLRTPFARKHNPTTATSEGDGNALPPGGQAGN